MTNTTSAILRLNHFSLLRPLLQPLGKILGASNLSAEKSTYKNLILTALAVRRQDCVFSPPIFLNPLLSKDLAKSQVFICVYTNMSGNTQIAMDFCVSET